MRRQPPKLNVSCYVEQKQSTPTTHTFRSERFEVEPLAIIRTPCGRGRATQRYHYTVVFKAPLGTIDVLGADISGRESRATIVRRDNPDWWPPRDGWDGPVWRPAGSQWGLRITT